MKYLKKFTNIFLIVAFWIIITNIKIFVPNQTIEVTTTNYPLKYIISEIGGDYVSVSSVYERFESKEIENDISETEVSSEVVYSAVPAFSFVMNDESVTEIMGSELYLYNGYSIENSYLKFIASHKNIDKLNVRDVSIDIPRLSTQPTNTEITVSYVENDMEVTYIIDIDDFIDTSSQENTFVWMSPMNMLQMAISVKDVLIELLPTKEEQIIENFTELKANLIQLDEEIKDVVNNGRNNIIICDSPIFAHLQGHGIYQIPINDSNFTSSRTEEELNDIIKIKDYYEIDYVVSGDVYTSEIFEQFVDENDLEVAVFYSLDVLSEEQYNNGENYITLMKKNIELLETILK